MSKIKSFSPIHEKHGIEYARVVILFEDKIEAEVGKRVSMKDHLLRDYQDSHQIRIENKEGTSSTSQSINGFVLRDELQTKVLHVFNDVERNVLTYTDQDYGRWAGFLDALRPVLKALSAELADNKITALALEYCDVFKWTGKPEDFRWNLLFNEKSEMLSKDFHEHTHHKFEVIRSRRSTDEINIVEQLIITRQNQDRAAIQHHVSLPLDGEYSSGKLGSNEFVQELENIHRFNKAVLLELFTDDISRRVGLTN